MITNAAMTIYNLWRNPETGEIVWHKQWLPAVHWYESNNVNAGSGLAPADTYKIRIPEDAIPEGYIDPEAYKRLDESDVGQHWTVDNGHLFVKGLFGDITRPKDLARYGTVNSFSDNRYGGIGHIRIGGA